MGDSGSFHFQRFPPSLPYHGAAKEPAPDGSSIVPLSETAEAPLPETADPRLTTPQSDEVLSTICQSSKFQPAVAFFCERYRPADRPTEEVVAMRIAEIAARLEPADRDNFFDFTIREAASAQRHGGKIEERAGDRAVPKGEAVLTMLEMCAANGSLGKTLPLLLRDFPPITLLASIAGRLAAIAAATESASWQVFNRALPNIISSQNGLFNENDLHAFALLASKSKEVTPDVCLKPVADLRQSLPESPVELVSTLFLITSTLESVGISSISQCVSSCCLFISLLDRPTEEDIRRIFGDVVALWQAWSSGGDAEKLNRQLYQLLVEKEPAVTAKDVSGILALCSVDPKKAGAIFDGSTALIGNMELEQLQNHFQRVHNRERSFERHLQPLAEFSAQTLRAERATLADIVLDRLMLACGPRKVADRLPFLTDMLTKFSADECAALRDDLPRIVQISAEVLTAPWAIELTPLTTLLVHFYAVSAESFNQWQPSPSLYRSRLMRRRNFYAPPAIEVGTHHEFYVPYSPIGSQVLLADNRREPVTDFIRGRERSFSLPRAEVARRHCETMVKLLYGPDVKEARAFHRDPPEVLQLVATAAQREDTRLFDQVAQLALPFLPAATGVRLPIMGAKFDAESAFDYLETLRLLINDRLPVTFERFGMARFYIDRLKSLARLEQVVGELAHFTRREPTHRLLIQMRSSKNIVDEFYDQMAETCLYKTADSDLENPIAQPVRLYAPELEDIIGCLFLAKPEIEGVISLMMAGGGPRRSILKALGVDVLADEIVTHLHGIANESQFDGGVYCALGSGHEDEGRGGQYPEFRAALLRRSRGILRVAPVNFPTNYRHGPVTRVFVL